MMNKTLVFDMDGTIANFYGVVGWLDYLKESNPPHHHRVPDLPEVLHQGHHHGCCQGLSGRLPLTMA